MTPHSDPSARSASGGERALGWRPTPRALADRLAARLPAALPAVLDPACGEGALLEAVLRRAGGDPTFARARLFGIELDPERAERARDRLRRLAGLPPGTELDRHIRCADALAEPWPADCWIVANPPWVSYSGRQSAGRHSGGRHSAMRRAAAGRRGLHESIPPGVAGATSAERIAVAAVPGGWPAVHSAFLATIARYLGEHGGGALALLPASMLELERYRACRHEVERWAIPRPPIVELGEDAFPGVLEPAVLLELAPLERLAAGHADRATPSGGERGHETSDRRESLGRDPLADAWRAAEPEWLASLGAFPRLPRGTFGDPGVHTGNCARELVLAPEAEGHPGLRQGRDLAPYRLGPPSARLFTELERDGERRFRIAPLERYRGVPVLLRQTANRPIAAEHAQPTYFRNSLLACTPPDGMAPAAMVALLNGPVAAAWHRARYRDGRQRSFPQVKVGALATLPFPFVRRDQAPRVHDELARLATAYARGEAGEAVLEQLERLALDAYGLADDVRAHVLELVR